MCILYLIQSLEQPSERGIVFTTSEMRKLSLRDVKDLD